MISKLLKKNKKGFTLMEMLIVVAIIAVLVAIAIPTFNASLNKARIATDEANICAGYASTLATVLTSDFDVEQATGEKAYRLSACRRQCLKVDSADATAPTGAYECKGRPTKRQPWLAALRLVTLAHGKGQQGPLHLQLR